MQSSQYQKMMDMFALMQTKMEQLKRTMKTSTGNATGGNENDRTGPSMKQRKRKTPDNLTFTRRTTKLSYTPDNETT